MKYHLGNQVKTIRRRNRLNQFELSKIVGVSRPQITNIESGKVGCSLKTLVQLCDGMDCTPNDLLGYESIPSHMKERKLKKELKKKIIEAIIESAENLEW